MTRARGKARPSGATLLLALFVLPLPTGAEAGVGERAGDDASAWKSWSPVERAQYYSFDNQDYCWYDDGWQGPGWYWCGYEWNGGFGWGGPYGWNGWGGGYRIRRHGPGGVGVWHPGAPPHGQAAGGAPAPPGSPGGGPAYRRFGAGSLSAHRPGAAGAPAYPGLQGGGVIGRGAPEDEGQARP